MAMEGAGGNEFTGGNFRFREDDGDERQFVDGGASYIAAINTSIARSLDGPNFRLRYSFNRSAAARSFTFHFYKSRNGGAFSSVTAASPGLHAVLSPHYVDNQDVPEFTDANEDLDTVNGWLTNVNGGMLETSASSISTSWGTGPRKYSTIEINLNFNSPAGVGDTFEVRARVTGDGFQNGYTQTAIVTVAAPPPPVLIGASIKRLNDDRLLSASILQMAAVSTRLRSRLAADTSRLRSLAAASTRLLLEGFHVAINLGQPNLSIRSIGDSMQISTNLAESTEVRLQLSDGSRISARIRSAPSVTVRGVSERPQLSTRLETSNV